MRWIIEGVRPARRRARQWIRQANAARDRRDWPAAREAYDRALQACPPMPPIWVQYGHAAKEAGDLPAAEAAYRRALSLQPDLADGYLHLGHALKLQGQADAALEAYGKAVSLAAEPEYPFQLGHALNGMGRRVAAVEAFRRALSLAPERADAALALGHVLLALKEPVGALEAYRHAFRVQPEQPASVWRQHGEAARGAGDLPAAEAAFRRAREVAQGEAARSPPATAPGAPPRFAVPLFLLAPPASAQVPWCFAPPGLARPGSQLCTSGQLEEPAYAAWCAKLALEPTQHRKPWEYCYIGAALEAAGLLQAGSRGLGFGCGQEPLPSYFAARGVAVTATDAPGDVVAAQGWQATDDHAAGLESVHRPELVSEAEFRRLVRFRAVDMNRLPAELAGFDFCWSACALEHLGSLRAGMDFIAASLGTLRPGGTAVHTMEFNLSSNAETMETPDLSVYRRQDIEALILELAAAGHEVATFNTHPGDREMDAHIDLPPYALPHLKLQLEGHTVTSFGMIIRKGGAEARAAPAVQDAAG